MVVRIKEWKNNSLVGDYKGCVVAIIPYQSTYGKLNALSIANQIVAANVDCSHYYQSDFD